MNKIPGGTRNTQSGILARSTRPMKDTLHHLAFDHSLQSNIIFSVSSGKVITANIAACELLGYQINELTDKSKGAIFEISESSFKAMLKQRTAKGHARAFVNALKKDGSVLPCEITSAVFIDEGIKKAITTIADLSAGILTQKNIDSKKEEIVAYNILVAQSKSDVRLAENNELIKYIAKTSYDVMWDWDISTGEIYVGDSILEVFGYNIKDNTVNFKSFSHCLLPEESSLVKKNLLDALASENKSWKDSFSFKRQDGSIASTTCRASIIRDDDRKAVRLIGAIHDISKLQELENKLEEQTFVPNVPQFSSDVLWELNIFTDEVCIGEGFENILGYTTHFTEGKTSDWRNYLHPDDKKAVHSALRNVIGSSYSHWEQTYRLIKNDGSSARMFNKASIFRRPDETAYRIVGIMRHLDPLCEKRGPGPGKMEDNNSKLVDKIKSILFKIVHYSEEKLPTNLSNHLSSKLLYDYTYLANVFSEVEGLSIQQYLISQKIERVKDLLEANELSLTEIALKLQYSSVAHLSNQFKKVTASTPSEYKKGKLQQL